MELVGILIDSCPECCNDAVFSNPFGDDNQLGHKGKGRGFSALHLACRYNAPVDVIRALLKKNPQLAQQFASDGDGCERGGTHLPIHAVCKTAGSSSFETIEALLEHYPNGASIPDGRNRLPLHLECMTQCRPNVIRMLLNVHRGGAEALDCQGRTAMHYAVETSQQPEDESWNEAVTILLDAFPGALEVKDNDGFVPSFVMKSSYEACSETKADEEKTENDDATNGNKRVVRFA